MKLKFFEANEINLKATIHQTGRLGFPTKANSKFDFETNKFLKIATSADAGDNNLYIVLCSEFEDGCFKIVKIGEYYNVNLKKVFDLLKYNYKEEKIIFDVINTEEKHQNKDIYKLVARVLERNKKGNDKGLPTRIPLNQQKSNP